MHGSRGSSSSWILTDAGRFPRTICPGPGCLIETIHPPGSLRVGQVVRFGPVRLKTLPGCLKLVRYGEG